MMIFPNQGVLLIANPFLRDPNFLRTVVLICNHTPEGTLGLTLNKTLPVTLAEVLPETTGMKVPVYQGGPVQPEILHFIHQYPDMIEGGVEISDGIYWGGDFESLKTHLSNNDLDTRKIRFFLGYSGWGMEQLNREIEEDGWLTVKATPKIVFSLEAKDIWKESLKELGGEYKQLINYPLDPQFN